jgi:hypothetical protein
VGRGLGGLPVRSTWNPKSLFVAGKDGGWWDVSDLSTLYVERTGALSTLASIDGPVGTVLDKSGNNHHAQAASDDTRPLLKQDSTGRYYLQFDGSNDYLALSPVIPFVADVGIEMFAGIDVYAPDSTYRILLSRDSSSPINTPAFYADLGNFGTPGIYDGGNRTNNLSMYNGGLYVGAWRVMLNGANRQGIVRVNRNQASTEWTNIQVANEQIVGINAIAGVQSTQCKLYSLIVLSGPLMSDDFLTKVESHLAKKCGVTLS